MSNIRAVIDWGKIVRAVLGPCGLLSGLLAGVLASATAARAQTIVDDPLHGFCFAAVSSCADNGTFTPIQWKDTNTQFGFDISPGPGTGDYKIEFLIPDTALNASSLTITVSGIHGGTADTQVIGPKTATKSLTEWNNQNQDLAAFLGLAGASPPIRSGRSCRRRRSCPRRAGFLRLHRRPRAKPARKNRRLRERGDLRTVA